MRAAPALGGSCHVGDPLAAIGRPHGRSPADLSFAGDEGVRFANVHMPHSWRVEAEAEWAAALECLGQALEAAAPSAATLELAAAIGDWNAGLRSADERSLDLTGLFAPRTEWTHRQLGGKRALQDRCRVLDGASASRAASSIGVAAPLPVGPPANSSAVERRAESFVAHLAPRQPRGWLPQDATEESLFASCADEAPLGAARGASSSGHLAAAEVQGALESMAQGIDTWAWVRAGAASTSADPAMAALVAKRMAMRTWLGAGLHGGVATGGFGGGGGRLHMATSRLAPRSAAPCGTCALVAQLVARLESCARQRIGEAPPSPARRRPSGGLVV